MPNALDDSTPTRESLLVRLKDWDDQTSWRHFFETYWKLIYGVANKSGLDPAEAQDVVQETVIAVVKNIQGFKYDPAVCSFKRWLLLITKRKIIDRFRRQQHRPGGESSSGSPDAQEPVEIIDPSGSRLEALWEAEWQQTLLQTALARIKEIVSAKQFQIFDLYVLRQWPVKEVAITLQTNVGHVYLVKHRVGALLKQEIRKLEHGLI